MIKFLFLTIPTQSTYDSLKSPIKFKQDTYGVSTWTMKHPLTIYSSDLKFRHVFKYNDVKIQQISNVSLQQKWKYFVITKGDGGKYYCTSQIIYEKGLLKTSVSHHQSQFFSSYSNSNTLTSTQQFYLPKCIVIISQLPYFKLQVNLLKIHKQLKKKQPAISYCIQQDLYELYLQLLQTGRQKQFDSINLSQIPSKRKTYCPIQLSFSYYIECCNNHSSGECIYIEKISNRQVLHLYKLHTSTLYQIGYFFHLPFSPFTLRKIISAILTEKQLVFSSSNSNLTVMVIETLMQMILPLKWCYMYAPNLPIQLLQAAQQSFMPFIVGISKQHLSLITKSNKIIVHIDTDQVQINYDHQQQQQLHLLSKKFETFLVCKTNSNKQYLQWQKQLRINSILMITTIFKKDLVSQRTLGGDYFSQQEKLSQQKFYQQFQHKSMMYRKLIQDVHENVYSEFYRLAKMEFNERKIFLQNKFNSLHSQTIYPSKCDNKKKWIKYYQKYMRQKRKTRLNRHSLSMVQHNLIGIVTQSNNNNQPFYGSNVSLNSLNTTNKLENYNNMYQNSQTFRSRLINNQANELYQSTISTQSLNSQSSTLKFNIHNHNNNANNNNNNQEKTISTSNKHFIFENGNENKQSAQKGINLLMKDKNRYQSNMKENSSSKNIGIKMSGTNNQVSEVSNNIAATNRKTYHTLTTGNSFIHNSSINQKDKVLGHNFNHQNQKLIALNKKNSQIIQPTTQKNPGTGSNPQYSYLASNNPNLNNHSISKNSNPVHQSYIFSTPQHNHLNQSMVNSLISPNSYQSGINNFKTAGILSNISSHRNLNQTQSTVVL